MLICTAARACDCQLAQDKSFRLVFAAVLAVCAFVVNVRAVHVCENPWQCFFVKYTLIQVLFFFFVCSV